MDRGTEGKSGTAAALGAMRRGSRLKGVGMDDILILTGQAMAVYLATAAFAVWCVVGLGER